MIINGKNILSELDNLEGKTVRILTIPEESFYSPGFKAVIQKIEKKYYEEGSYNIYVLTLDFSPYEKENEKHDIGGYGENEDLKWNQTDFYTGTDEYIICVEYDKYQLKFKEDIETDFFEVIEPKS